MTLRELCESRTDLTQEEICQLELVEQQLPLIAEMAAADVFIDCRSGADVIVAAHARPGGEHSVYTGSVVGKPALPEDEPAVFHAFATGDPVCDLRAVTQEGRSVLQNVAPIRSRNGRVTAVLIREKDVSEDMRMVRKYRALAQSHEDSGPLSEPPRGEGDGNLLALREMHHRVKNNLQLVASILSMQGRKCADPSTRRILQENVARVLSIATIHDILTYHSEDFQYVSSRILFDKLRMNLQSLVTPGKAIVISVDGDDVLLDADTATPVSLVITELLTNALEHAFEGREGGRVTVSLRAGALCHTVTVTDDGIGFDPNSLPDRSLGLSIVSATVRDKLKGKLRIQSDSGGSKITFDFRA